MPHRLKERQERIQQKRRNTSWREFLLEVCTSRTLMLYKNNQKISRYPESNRQSVLVGSDELDSYGGDLLMFGIDLDVENKSFFSLFHELYTSVPQGFLIDYGGNENALYADGCYRSKKCYLSGIIINDCENVSYSYNVKDGSKDVYSSLMVWNGAQNVYMSMGIIGGSNVFYSRYIINSSEIWFSHNLIGCSYCIRCSGLQNQSYCIDNIQFDKEEFYLKRKEILMNKQLYLEYHKPVLEAPGYNTPGTSITGSFCRDCDDISNGHSCFQVIHGRNCIFAGGPDMKQNFYDVFSVGAGASSEDFYAVCGAGLGSFELYCCMDIVNSSKLYYCINLETCSYCLGCIGLKNKSYCILNKQYTKQERYNKVDEIFSGMEKKGTLGRFFPGTMNPFYFNDTVAYLIDPTFTKQEVEAKGHLRRDDPIKVDIPEGVQTVNVDELHRYEGRTVGTEYLPSSGRDIPEEAIRKIDPEILKKVVVDENGNAWRVIPLELEFLQKHGLPLPRRHWLERLKGHFSIGRST